MGDGDDDKKEKLRDGVTAPDAVGLLLYDGSFTEYWLGINEWFGIW